MALKMLTEETAAEAGSILGIPGDGHYLKGIFRRRFIKKIWPGVKKGKFWWFDVEDIRDRLRA